MMLKYKPSVPQRAKGWVASLFGSCLVVMVAGCDHATPKGQVLASVGGQDVTLQDVRAEGRASNVPENAGAQADAALLQRVIERKLLDQSAHAQKLDQTPTAPSDLARIQQTWLAEKAAGKALSGLKPPTDADVSAFIASHPFAFSQRQRITARTITIASAPALLTTLKTFTTYDQAEAFLKRLGVAMSTGVGQLDTAQLPTAAAEQVSKTPEGALIVSEPPGRIQISEVQNHTSVVASPEQQRAFARQSFASIAIARRVAGELNRLRLSTKITYQPGYEPKATQAAAVRAGY